MNAPKIPQSWDECTMEELIEIHRLIQEYGPERRDERNLHIWLYLAKLVIVSGEGETDSDGVRTYSLRRKGRDDGERFLCNSFDLGLYLNGVHVKEEEKGSKQMRQRIEKAGALDWVDLAVGDGKGEGGLQMLPEETISFGGRTFELPSAMITNITYEQYGNVQKLQQLAWSLADGVREACEAITEKEKSIADVLAQKDASGDTLRDAERMKGELKQQLDELQEKSDELGEAMARVLSHLLLPKRWKVGKQGWIDNLRQHGLFVWKYDWKYDTKYISDDAERMVPWMVRHAPAWLFDILVQHLQSCLGVYKSQFPELFSDSDGNGRDIIPLVAEVDTVNAIMKWQSYPGQQEVYDSNAIQIFSILNSMTKEAKAIEEANQKMHSHARR